jgi:predicted MFS family arabinose efflux permease
MKPGSWGSIWLVYFYSILCMASIGKLVPIEADIERAFNTTPAGVGFAISIVAVFSAIAATIGGGIIDRIGPRLAIIITSVIIVGCNLVSFFSTSMFMLDAARLVEGIEFIGIIVAAPALIMATTTGQRQVRAMTLWSTYTPTGYTLGLLLAVPFAGTLAWRWTFIVHGALFAVAALLGGMLPEIPRSAGEELPSSRRARLADLFSIYREAQPWKLSISNALLVSIGLGTSTVVPAYFARTHHISVAASSSILAVANLAMIMGALGAGYLLTRGMRTIYLYIAITLSGMASGFFLYAPWLTFSFAISALIVWLLTTGAAVAILMALLPKVVKDPTRGGAAAGLVGQVMAFTNFVTPPLYLSMLAKQSPLPLVALVLSGWILSLVFLPAWRKLQAVPATASAVRS